MKSLLIIAQKVDEGDDLLGFFVDWIREFKKNIPTVNVVSLNSPKKSWLGLFFSMMWRIPRCDAVFVHMSPIFAVLAGPWAWLWRKPIYLWYLHRSLTWKLKAASWFSKKILTASSESLTLKSGKIVSVGHGINADRFISRREWDHKMRLLSVGRISPIKNFETLILTGLEATIVGRPVMRGDDVYLERLKTMGGARIHFVGFVPYTEMPKYYADSDIVINLSPSGGIDKVVLEGMAAGCLVVVANKAFNAYISDKRCFFEYGNAEDLTRAIKNLTALSPDEKQAMSRGFVDSVKQYHSLPVTIKKILDIMQQQ